jgi:hypothetical protein
MLISVTVCRNTICLQTTDIRKFDSCIKHEDTKCLFVKYIFLSPFLFTFYSCLGLRLPISIHMNQF